MSTTIGLTISFIAFLGASGLTAKSVFTDAKVNYKLLFSLASIAVVFQLISVKSILFAEGELHFPLAAMCLLVNVLITSVLTIRSLKHANLTILLVTYLFSALLCLGLLIVPSDASIYSGSIVDSSTPLFIHVVLSMAAYCVLVIASLYAVQFRYIDAKLKAKTLSLNSHLPPLNVVESQQFRLMSIGLILLTVALITGFAFLDNMWSKEYAHKTVLSVIAWGMFAVLAYGHKQYGWRGNNSAIATIIAAIVLTLAYFGSRFVKEILLN
ncbi:MAG: cytochrome c biogenesis protein CcsA [Gammaproteobacteria bacterium]|nr:cytochrome c biogenesis protein CcsA [Gammaproteobacteria bacterium]